jgi:uncharacterized SAM-binding protein YcdF (DUF218 family)
VKLRIALLAVALVVVYFVVTLGQVWAASRRDDARVVDAIVVLGAAQYDGEPSPVLRARLDHAATLYRRRLAGTVVVTGGRQPGDRFSEAHASARYLTDRKGVPEAAVLWEPYGRTTWEQLASVARFLERRGMREVVLVSDPFHSARAAAIAGERGLDATVSPTRASPISGVQQVPYLLKEAVAVGIGRIVGYRRIA